MWLLLPAIEDVPSQTRDPVWRTPKQTTMFTFFFCATWGSQPNGYLIWLLLLPKMLLQRRLPWRSLSFTIARCNLTMMNDPQARHLNCTNASASNRISFVSPNSNHLQVSFSKIWQNHIHILSKRTLSGDSFIDENAYEDVADETLDILADKFETFLDQLEDKSYDIVFNVSDYVFCFHQLINYFLLEWSHYISSWWEWHICDKQANAKPANLAIFSN